MTDNLQTVLVDDEVWPAFKAAFEREHPNLEMREIDSGVWAIAFLGTWPLSVTERYREDAEASADAAAIEELAADEHTCPECVEGKHRNCRGNAWCTCDGYDGEVRCACSVRAHARVDAGGDS